jgi:hypothetical protein
VVLLDMPWGRTVPLLLGHVRPLSADCLYFAADAIAHHIVAEQTFSCAQSHALVTAVFSVPPRGAGAERCGDAGARRVGQRLPVMGACSWTG